MKQPKVIWIPEDDAAKLMGYRPKTLRRYVQNGKLTIGFTKVNHKTFEYSQTDIEDHRLRNSSLLN
jgi:predicted site-specific integrase-resolvase